MQTSFVAVADWNTFGAGRNNRMLFHSNTDHSMFDYPGADLTHLEQWLLLGTCCMSCW